MPGFFFGDDLFKDDDRYDASDKRFYGCAVALVTNNKDPEKMGRVKLRYPWLDAELESNWARCMQIMTGDGRGWWNIPEIDDEVIVSFEHGDPQFPYVIGHVWNGQDRPPKESMMNVDGKNDIRMYESRSGHRLVFDDDPGKAHARLVDRSGKNYIRLWNPENKVEVVASDGDHFYKAPAKRILIEAKNLVWLIRDSATVTAGTEHTVNVGENMAVQSGANTTITAGTSIDFNADAGMTQTSGAGQTMTSNLFTITGADSTNITTGGDLSFMSLILMKLGFGVFNTETPIFGLKTLIAQLTNGGAKMKTDAKIVTLDGLKITSKAATSALTAKLIVLVKAMKINLNVGGPPATVEKSAPGGVLESIRQKLAAFKTQLERLSSVINAAIGKLPSFLQAMAKKFLKDALLDLFSSFLPPAIAESLAALLSGEGLTGPLGDLLSGLEDTDYSGEFMEWMEGASSGGEADRLAPEGEGEETWGWE